MPGQQDPRIRPSQQLEPSQAETTLTLVPDTVRSPPVPLRQRPVRHIRPAQGTHFNFSNGSNHTQRDHSRQRNYPTEGLELILSEQRQLHYPRSPPPQPLAPRDLLRRLHLLDNSLQEIDNRLRQVQQTVRHIISCQSQTPNS
jgi:hypothetical protein